MPGADVVIKLTAEKEEAVKLSVKGKVGPFWMSVKQYEVTGSPFIYKIHATKPLDQIISKETAQELELGYPAVRGKMKMHLIRGKAAPEDEGIVWQGLLKIKERANLYNIVEDPAAPGDLRRQALQALFPLSPAATEGRYQVESYCFNNGELVGYGKDVIEIKKVGLEHWLTQTSKNHPVFFGIMAVVIAVGAGLLVGVIFGKGGHH